MTITHVQPYQYVIAEICYGGGLQRIDIPSEDAGVTDQAETLAAQIAASVSGVVTRLYVPGFEEEGIAA